MDSHKSVDKCGKKYYSRCKLKINKHALYNLGVIFLSERPNRTTSAGQSEGNPLGEIREGFDEIYGNIEGFSKRAVGSLFDDDEKSSGTMAETRDTKPELARPGRSSSRPERPERFERSEKPERPGSAVSPYHNPDPDEAYARYIRTAEKANREEQEKQRVGKERAIIERDEKLSEVSYISKRGDNSKLRARTMEEADLHLPAHRARRQINVRNLAAAAAFLVLMICVVLTWQMLSARAELAAVQERLEGLDALELENNSLNIANNGLNNTISQLENRIDGYLSRLEAWENMFGTSGVADENNDPDPDAPDNGNGNAAAQTPTQPAQGDLPYTTIDAAGNRVYTMQSGDTLWSIAMRVYNDGSRFTDILRANNLTEAQAAVLPAGTILIIPD